MGRETGISWTNHTFNFWWGCTKVSPGCKNCYAETFSKRYKWDIWGPGKPRRTFPDKHFNEPRNWQKQAMQEGKMHTVFCGSMMDWCDEEAPAEERAKIFPLIRETPFLLWLMLTKRPERIPACLPNDWSVKRYPNVAMGTSIENDDYVWRAEAVKKIDASYHFISAEPLLGPLPSLNLKHIEWVIVGGESGGGWRKMELDWARQLRDRCLKEEVSFFYKQGNGERSGMDPILDGVEYKNYPWRVSLL